MKLKSNIYGKHYIFSALQKIIKLFSRKYIVLGKENLTPDKPVVFLSNHLRMLGPFVVIIFFDIKFRPWVISDMFKIKSCAKYLHDDFIVNRLKIWKPFCKTAALIFAVICVALAKSSGAIPAYRDSNLAKSTFDETRDAILKGQNIFIFPEKAESDHSKKSNDIYGGFVHFARMMHRKTGIELIFHPVYIDKDTKSINILKALKYKSKNSFIEEKERLVSAVISMISFNDAEINTI